MQHMEPAQEIYYKGRKHTQKKTIASSEEESNSVKILTRTGVIGEYILPSTL